MDNLLTYSIKSIICDIKIFSHTCVTVSRLFLVVLWTKVHLSNGGMSVPSPVWGFANRRRDGLGIKTEKQFDASREAIQMKLL